MAICKTRNGELGNGMMGMWRISVRMRGIRVEMLGIGVGMMGMRGIRVEMLGIGVGMMGMRGIRVGMMRMRGIRVGMMGMRGIRVGMRGIKVGMRGIGVGMWSRIKIKRIMRIYRNKVSTFWYEKQLKKPMRFKKNFLEETNLY